MGTRSIRAKYRSISGSTLDRMCECVCLFWFVVGCGVLAGLRGLWVRGECGILSEVLVASFMARDIAERCRGCYPVEHCN